MPTKTRPVKSLRSRHHQLLIELLAESRLEAGLTQQQLAERLRRPQSFVAKYEGGERRIDVVEFIGIAKAINADPVKLLQKLLKN